MTSCTFDDVLVGEIFRESPAGSVVLLVGRRGSDIGGSRSVWAKVVVRVSADRRSTECSGGKNILVNQYMSVREDINEKG